MSNTPPTIREALEEIVKWLDNYTDHETLDSGRFTKPTRLLRQAHAALASDSMKDNDERHG